MATHLPDWERKNYTLPDGKPCLFYVAFGRADGPFSVSRGTYRCAGRHTPAKYREAVIELINRFIEFQAFGGLIEEGREIRVDGLPAGMRCHHRGNLEDPEFNNVYVAIEWPA